jgi:hypothetical protein
MIEAFDSKRMKNTPETIQCALKFNDCYTGLDRVNFTKTLLHSPEEMYQGNRLDDKDLVRSRESKREFFNRLNLEIEKQPFRAEASSKFVVHYYNEAFSCSNFSFVSVLTSPNLKFRNALSDGNKGTWNTKQMKFEVPAVISSFAMVNCCDSERNPEDLTRNVRHSQLILSSFDAELILLVLNFAASQSLQQPWNANSIFV